MDQQGRDPDFLKRLRTLVASYLESHEPLHIFATHFADLWEEMSVAVTAGRLEAYVLERLRREVAVLRTLRNVRPEEARRIQDLLEAGLSRVTQVTKGLPNKRLKLLAPGFGKTCVCALTGFVVGSRRVAPTGVGAAA